MKNQLELVQERFNSMNTQENYSIGDVAELLDVQTYTIRYWEKEFSAFLNPPRCKGGHRRYGSYEVDILRRIKSMLKDEKYSIAGARQKLQALLLGKKSDEQELVLAKLVEFIADKVSKEPVLKG
jgi:DNA-binding transcriptional MerR regulator